MAVKDKRKPKPRNQATNKAKQLSSEPMKSRKTKAKRVEKKKPPQPSKKNKNKKHKTKNKDSKMKPVNELNLQKTWLNTKKWIRQSKQLIFWSVLLFVMFFLRFNEEGFGAFQKMRSSEDLYKVLESEPHFSKKQIKGQYRKLVAQFHPDTNPNCSICEEKITSINKAYEVLKDPESRKIYDQTKGIVDPIRSNAKNLDTLQFRKKVVEGDRPMIIQIYAENSDMSRSFAGFWEDFIVEHNYLDFARINMSTEPKLANSLGFGVEELPFVFSHVPGRDYEFFELDEYYQGSTSSLLNKFVKKVVKRNAKEISFEQFHQLERKEGQISVIFIRRGFSPLVYEYLALRFKKYAEVNFYTTKLNEHRKFYKHFKNDDLDYVLLMPSNFETGIRKVSINEESIQAGGDVSSDDEDEKSEDEFSFDPTKTGNSTEFKTPKKILKHYIVTNYLKSQMIPTLFRHSFEEFCKKDFTSFDGQIALPTMCILGLEGPSTGNFQETMKRLNEIRSELEEDAYQAMAKSQESVSQHVHRFQFGSIDLTKNKLFTKTLVESVSVKNPRVFIYLSESDQFMIINSFQDLDDIVEDAKEGIFQDYRSYRSMINKDIPIEDLLLNENISLLKVIDYEVRQMFWKAVSMLIVMLVLNSYVLKIPGDKLVMGYVVVIALFLGFMVTEKMVRELVW
jgi:curved DNA-binding protein CbpA